MITSTKDVYFSRKTTYDSENSTVFDEAHSNKEPLVNRWKRMRNHYDMMTRTFGRTMDNVEWFAEEEDSKERKKRILWTRKSVGRVMDEASTIFE